MNYYIIIMNNFESSACIVYGIDTRFEWTHSDNLCYYYNISNILYILLDTYVYYL